MPSIGPGHETYRRHRSLDLGDPKSLGKLPNTLVPKSFLVLIRSCMPIRLPQDGGDLVGAYRHGAGFWEP